MSEQQNLKKAVFNWSGGKDSALALQKILKENKYEVIALLTTFNEKDQTSSAHSIPLHLMKKQAKSMGIELFPVFINKEPGDYEVKMRQVVDHFLKLGVAHFIFGDLYIKEVRKYRESKLNPLGIEVVEPIWGKTPEQVMENFFDSGIKAKIVTIQADKLDSNYIGKDLSPSLIKEFPKGIDICGENGEYHTFAYAGDLFKKEIDLEIIETYKLSFDIRLDTGEVNTFHYWQAKFKE